MIIFVNPYHGGGFSHGGEIPKKLLIPFLVSLFGALVLIVCIFISGGASWTLYMFEMWGLYSIAVVIWSFIWMIIDIFKSRKIKNTPDEIRNAIIPPIIEDIKKEKPEVKKIKIVLDKKEYEIGQFFTLNQLKILAGVNNQCYGICLIIPACDKDFMLNGNRYGYRGAPDYEIISEEEVHDGIGLLHMMGRSENAILNFFSYHKTTFNV